MNQPPNDSLWSPTPVCSCTGAGKSVMFEGVEVVFRNPACRVHVTTLTFNSVLNSAEAIEGNWRDRERQR